MKPEIRSAALRYLVGGATTTVLTWGCVWIFVELFSLHYLISVNLATAAAYLYSYFVNKVFVFQNADKDHVVKGSKFLFLQLSLVAWTNLFMYCTVSILALNYMIAVVLISIINAVISFAIMQTKIFGNRTLT